MSKEANLPSYQKNNNLVRADRDVLTPKNIVALLDHYGGHFEIINDLGFYLSHKIKDSQTNIYGSYEFTLKEFCALTGRNLKNLNKNVKDEEGNIIVADEIKDGSGKPYQLTTVFEHAIRRMATTVTLKNLTKYREGTEMSFQNFNFINGFKVYIPDKRTKQRVYEIIPNQTHFGALIKNFVDVNLIDFNVIRGKKLYPLFMHLLELRSTAFYKFETNKIDEVVSSPYFEQLKEICQINSSKPSYAKQKIEQKIKAVQQNTTINFRYTWTKTDSMQFPFQLHIFWENEKATKKEIELLYKLYNESYWNFLLKELYDEYRLKAYDLENYQIKTYNEWFNLPETKKNQVDAFVKSYNFIQSKDVNAKSEVVYKRFGVFDSYTKQLKEFHKTQLNGEASKFKSWFTYVTKEKSPTKNYKDVRLNIYRSCIEKNLGYKTNNKTISESLIEMEKMIKS